MAKDKKDNKPKGKGGGGAEPEVPAGPKVPPRLRVRFK